MSLLERFISPCSYNLENLSDETIFKQIERLRHRTRLEGYILEVRYGISRQVNFEIAKDSLETNLFRTVFYGKYFKKNEEWEFGGRFGYEKYSRMILLVSYIFLIGLLALSLIMPGLKMIASGVYCVISFLIIFQIIAYAASTNDRNVIQGMIENSILGIRI
jgi:hypothetical protein